MSPVKANMKLRDEGRRIPSQGDYYIGDTFVGWRWLSSMFVRCAFCGVAYLTLIESVEQHCATNHADKIKGESNHEQTD